MKYKFEIPLKDRILQNRSIISIIEKSKIIYMIGISGIGMSALALLLKGIGKSISGSSDVENEQTINLKKQGINVFIGHKKENIKDDIELVIRSEAISIDNIEYIETNFKNIPVITYGEGLSYFFNIFESVAIAGTHGKSSVSGMLVDALWDSKQISYLVGTNVKKTKSNGDFKGGFFIGEACEYKETFSNFYPDYIIIPSLDMDHVDYYKNKKNYLNSFKDFILHLKGEATIILNLENRQEIELAKFIISIPFLKSYCFYSNFKKRKNVIKKLKKIFNKKEIKKILSYIYFYNYKGTNKEGKNKFFVTEILVIDKKNINWKKLNFNSKRHNYNVQTNSDMDIFVNNKSSFKKIIDLEFPIPSVEYGANITSVYIFLRKFGLSKNKIKKCIKNYKGIERRFDLMGVDKNNNIVINDYAHHPLEIRTFLKMVKQRYPDKQIISIFQAHQYSRTYYLFNEFVNSFDIPDYVVFLPIYKQRDTEEDMKKVSHKMLCSALSEKRKSVYCFDYEKELFNFLENFKNSVILFIGAGSIINIANKYINLNI